MHRSVPSRVREIIVTDELGIASGIFRKHLVSSLYQPIFSVRGSRLLPLAVAGVAQIKRDYQPVSKEQFLERVEEDERFILGAVCRALHLRNFEHLDAAELQIFLNYDPNLINDLDSALAQISFLMHRLKQVGIDPKQLVFQISEPRAAGASSLQEIIRALRHLSIRIAVDNFGSEWTDLEMLESLGPDIVKIESAWFHRVARAESAARLIGNLIAGFQKKGMAVLIDGVERPDHLQLAIEAGANLVEGALLAKPIPAGTIFECDGLDIDSFRSPRDQVVIPLR